MVSKLSCRFPDLYFYHRTPPLYKILRLKCASYLRRGVQSDHLIDKNWWRLKCKSRISSWCISAFKRIEEETNYLFCSGSSTSTNLLYFDCLMSPFFSKFYFRSWILICSARFTSYIFQIMKTKIHNICFNDDISHL